MSDTQFTIDDMINAARAESPSDFQSAFASVVLDKISDAVQAKKLEVAKNYFNYEDAEASVETETQPAETEEAPNEDTETTVGSEEA